jgi:hypothetical protein
VKSYITFWYYWSPILRYMIAPVIQIMDKIFKALRMKNQLIESQNSRYNTSIT